MVVFLLTSGGGATCSLSNSMTCKVGKCMLADQGLLLHGSFQVEMILQVVRKPEEGDYIGHLRAEGLMEIARIFQVRQLNLGAPYIFGQ